MDRMTFTLVLLALALGAYALARAEAGDPEPPPAPKGERHGAPGAEPQPRAEPASETNDERFHARLKAAARVYRGYARVDDEARWAPLLCRMPLPGRVRYSASADAETHGHKLYYLFAKDRSAYVRPPAGEAPHPVGQVVVKEAWTPALEPQPAPPVGDEQPATRRPQLRVPDAEIVTDTFVSDGVVPGGALAKPAPKGETVRLETVVVPVVEREGKRYRAAELAGLYVMLKLDPATEGTDRGWVYGTLTPDGTTVTSAGRVRSCLACHARAAHDRLFGLPQPK